MANKKVSLRKIAQMCNLSPSTISRIVNGQGSFTDETVRLVLSTMQENGYDISNLESAKTLDQNPVFSNIKEKHVTADKTFVGVIVSDFLNDMFAALLEELGKLCREENITLLILSPGYNIRRTEECMEELIQLGAKGVFLLGASVTDLNIDIPGDFPVIHLSFIAFSKLQPEHYFVVSDEFVGGQMAARELLRCGCKNPVILNNRRADANKTLRIEGFFHEFAAHGITIDKEKCIIPDMDKSSFMSAKDTITYLYTKGVDFDSVFACSDWRAQGALTALENMDVPVPEKIRVVGYDGTRVSRYSKQTVTTIQQDVPMLAKNAIDMMSRLIKGETLKDRQILVPIRVQSGMTC